MENNKRIFFVLIEILASKQVIPAFVATLFLLLVQQLIVASSSFWLAEFSRGLQFEVFKTSFFVLFMSSLILPYVPAAFSLASMKRWEYRAMDYFWGKQIQAAENNQRLWSEREIKSIHSSVLSKDGPQLISETIKHLYDVFSAGLNVLLSLVMLSILLDYKILIGFVAGAILLFFGTNFTKKFNQIAGGKYENNKLDLSNWMNIFWDNIVLGNSYNSQSWKVQFRIKNTRYFEAKTELVNAQEVTSTFISMLGFIPTLSLMAYYGFTNASHPQDLIPLIALFPRVFILLNTTASLVYLLRNSYAFYGRWEHLISKLEARNLVDLNERIKFTEIKTNGSDKQVDNVHDFLNQTRQSAGRVTIRGLNGVGKSSLLLLLKEKFGQDSIYLPHENQLVFEGVNGKCSTGQKLAQQFSNLINNSNADIILLDEWDANLDHQKIKDFNAKIDQLARTKMIYEVRHRE